MQLVRYSLTHPHALTGVGVVALWEDSSERQQMRPDASGSRPRAHCTESSGEASSRQAAELHRIINPPDQLQQPDRATPPPTPRCESAAARMVGGGTHFDRGRDFQPPVLPSQSRRTSHDDRAAPCGSEMEPPTQPSPPASCLPLCPHCAPAPSFRPLSRGSTTQKPRFTDRLQTNA